MPWNPETHQRKMPPTNHGTPCLSHTMIRLADCVDVWVRPAIGGDLETSNANGCICTFYTFTFTYRHLMMQNCLQPIVRRIGVKEKVRGYACAYRLFWEYVSYRWSGTCCRRQATGELTWRNLMLHPDPQTKRSFTSQYPSQLTLASWSSSVPPREKGQCRKCSRDTQRLGLPVRYHQNKFSYRIAKKLVHSRSSIRCTLTWRLHQISFAPSLLMWGTLFRI